MKKNGRYPFLAYMKQEFKPLIAIFYNKKDLVHLLSFIAGSLCVVFGALAILGWHTHNYVLYQIRPSFTPMYYNTALCFIFLGVGLNLHCTHYKKIASVMGFTVVGLSGIILSQYIFNTNLGIDEFFFQSNVSIHASAPGRMSYNSAISFLACGLSLILLSFKRPSQFVYYIVLLLAIGAFVFGLTSLIGYAAQLPDTFLWSKLTPMSLQSTIGVMLASGGIIASVYIKSVSREINLAANLPYLAVFFVFCLTSLLWNASLQEGIERVYEITSLQGEKVQKVVSKTIGESVSDLEELAAHLAMFPKITEKVWQNSVEYYRKKNSFYESISWVDASYVVKGVESLKEHEGQLRHSLKSLPFLQKELERAKEKREVRISPIDVTPSGESRFHICIPFFDKSSFKGYIIAAVNIRQILSALLKKDEEAAKFEIAFNEDKDQTQRFFWTIGQFYQDIYSRTEIELYNQKWVVDVWPSSDLVNHYKYTLLSKLIVLIGIFFALLLFSSIRARQLIKKQAHMLQKTKNNLEVQLRESGRHAQELRLLKDMTDAVQGCISLKETAEVMSKFCELLLPSTLGEISLSNSTQTKLKQFAFWGSSKPNTAAFPSDDCFCIQQKATSYVNVTPHGKVCKHIKSMIFDHGHVTHFCIPFYEHETLLGLLTVHDLRMSHQSSNDHKKLLLLLETFANQISLSISSIKLRERLKEQAIRDPLTNLYNRRYLEESLQRELYRAQRYSQPVSIIMADIDHFKLINDTYGHDGGDVVLKSVAQVLQKYYRKSDMACRFGGEEFVLVLPQMTLDVALQRAQKIRESAEALKLSHHGKKIKKVTLSLGVSSFPQHGQSLHDLISVADQALYKAKKSGRNRVEVGHKNSKSNSAKLKVVN